MTLARPTRRGFGAVVAVVLVAVASTARGDESAAFFAADDVPRLRLEIGEKSRQRLREEPRSYAVATLVENDERRLEKVAVKLKGAAGSYQEFDDRPGLTVRVDRRDAGRTLHGMAKFHLNNAVQDETFLSEWLGWQLLQDAGYPAPRVAHVRLWINDRDMGLYVVREGFDAPFLRRAFGAADGTLYDGGFLQDVDEPLEVDLGADKDDREALRRL
jgi:spore coat protein H